MLNSEFDTVIRSDGDYYGNNKKNKKIKIIIVVFVLLILLAGGILAYLKYEKDKKMYPKNQFMKYVQETNIGTICDITVLKKIQDKMKQSPYMVNNKLSFEPIVSENPLSGILMNSMDLSRFNLDININKNNEGFKESEIVLNNSDNQMIKFSYLEDDTSVAVKSDDIVTMYVGCKKDNIQDVEEKFLKYFSNEDQEEGQADIIMPENTSSSNEKIFDGPKIEKPNGINLYKYKELIEEKILMERFTIEYGVTLTQKSKSIQADLYEFSLPKEEFLQFLTEFKNLLLNDSGIINNFITGQESDDIYNNILKLVNGYKMDFSEEQFGKLLEEGFSDFYDSISKLDNVDFKFDIYVKDEKVIKKSIDLGEFLKIEVESGSEKNNEYYSDCTLIFEDENKKKDGISIKLDRTNNDVSTVFECELSIIEDMQINNKFTIKAELEGDEKSTEISNKISLVYNSTNNKYSTNLLSKLQFDNNKTIERLDQNNCFFLDEIGDEDFVLNVNAIIEQTKIVIQNKINEIFYNGQEEVTQENENQLEGIINMDALIDQNNEEENFDNNEEDEQRQQDAMNKLIMAIQNAMTEAESEGRDYTLNDLSNLQVIGSTLSVMVGENMAVVAIDGYTFYIDANFTLTTE